MKQTEPAGEGGGTGNKDEAADWSGWIGKALLVASPFVLILVFLVLESWIRGRF